MFSILTLHENPYNEAVRSLVRLVENLKSRLDIKLYVAPITIEESKRVLRAASESLGRLRLRPNMIEPALKAGLSGVVQRFVVESTRANPPASAESYFSPYITNLIQIVRQNGVEFFNEKMDRYQQDKSVLGYFISNLFL
jgi:hypothetical protein